MRFSFPSLARSPLVSGLPIVLGALFAIQTLAIANDAAHCHPPIDRTKPQFVIGIGSLMEKSSKERTAPNTGANLPVMVHGFQRRWSARGSDIGSGTTYLAAVTDPEATMAAAMYRVLRIEDLMATDEREAYYCRAAVDPNSIEPLDGSTIPETGQFWLYVSQPDAAQPPNDRFPIVQSYVDIFISGCLQLSELAINYDADFAEACVETTSDWSTHWVNDRVYPRRPFIYQPNAGRIDRLLHRLVPEFQSIRIE